MRSLLESVFAKRGVRVSPTYEIAVRVTCVIGASYTAMGGRQVGLHSGSPMPARKHDVFSVRRCASS